MKDILQFNITTCMLYGIQGVAKLGQIPHDLQAVKLSRAGSLFSHPMCFA